MKDCNSFLEDLKFIRSNLYKNPRQARMSLDSLINYYDVKTGNPHYDWSKAQFTME